MSQSPILYETNTRCWLRSLSEREGRGVTLADVPDAEFALWQRLGFTHIWLMGVWTTGPRSRAQALNDLQLRRAFSEALPGWREEDVAGSPYAIGSYEVAASLGGESALATFRERLNARGIKLLLDFVPNHLGLDHRWIMERPELFVQSPVERAGTFRLETRAGTRWLANGKDPYFAPWADTVQLDYRLPETRVAMAELLRSVARRCDGVRCDMAMLVLNDVFARTWEQFPVSAAPPASEFWAEAIGAVRAVERDFVFLAEAYWGLESRLQALGFDFTYDKHVYDCLVNREYAELQRHLLEAAPKDYVVRSAHFLENHDERRIASLLSPTEHCAAALLVLGMPGLRFLHEGQLTGAKVHVPVQLARGPKEPVDAAIHALYDALLSTLRNSAVGAGDGKLLSPETAWPGNPTAQNFIVIQWQKNPAEFDLVVVNLAPHRGQCRVRLAIEGLAGHRWEMRDPLGNEMHQRNGDELAAPGLFLDLPEHGAQLFHFTATQ